MSSGDCFPVNVLSSAVFMLSSTVFRPVGTAVLILEFIINKCFFVIFDVCSFWKHLAFAVAMPGDK